MEEKIEHKKQEVAKREGELSEAHAQRDQLQHMVGEQEMRRVLG